MVVIHPREDLLPAGEDSTTPAEIIDKTIAEGRGHGAAALHRSRTGEKIAPRGRRARSTSKQTAARPAATTARSIPTSIDDYLAVGGYSALAKALHADEAGRDHPAK
ncbi:MAG: hypothetical protein MZU91_06645 [Desulfosudis oleivorans]|nr:hypothetical protein [Desulfosudis oleivorans]